MSCAALFVTAKTHIKNPYLRAKFVEVRTGNPQGRLHQGPGNPLP